MRKIREILIIILCIGISMQVHAKVMQVDPEVPETPTITGPKNGKLNQE